MVTIDLFEATANTSSITAQRAVLWHWLYETRACNQADGQQNGWKYYGAKEIDELISANMIMCSGRASVRVRWTVRTAAEASCVRRTASVRLTWFRDEIYLQIKQARARSPALRHVSLCSSSDQLVDCSRLRSQATRRPRLPLGNFVCFERRRLDYDQRLQFIHRMQRLRRRVVSCTRIHTDNNPTSAAHLSVLSEYANEQLQSWKGDDENRPRRYQRS